MDSACVVEYTVFLEQGAAAPCSHISYISMYLRAGVHLKNMILFRN